MTSQAKKRSASASEPRNSRGKSLPQNKLRGASKSPPHKPAGPLTKRQLTKFQKETRQRNLLMVALAVVIAVVVAIPAYGVWQETHRGDTQIARVYGVDITAEQYAKVLGMEQIQLDFQIANYQSILNTPVQPDQSDSAASLYQYAQQMLPQLQQQKSNLQFSVLQNIIDSALIRREAGKRKLTLGQTEYDQYIVDTFGTAPQEDSSTNQTPEPVASPGATPAATATPIPEPTPKGPPDKATVDEALVNMRKTLADIGLMNENEYRNLLAEPALLANKLRDSVGADVPTTTAKVRVQHILVTAETDALAVLTRLRQGADFASLAKEVSTDTGTKDSGGDLGWFGRGEMDPAFEEAAFALLPGQLVTQPISTTYGYHIIRGEEQNPAYPLDPYELEQAKNDAFNAWLTEQGRDSKNVEYYVTSDKLQWANDYIASKTKAIRARLSR